ncbi:conjugal transfer protein [Kineococcus rhizosphaerae]|uniref:conjugal transfer protein n=1 Tax=Kineococcus rhizosphaerae TaxID=559628 RepID=UPI001475EC90|nr:conjugal transfer protein [Kineococcus rhizosphaerae]
MLIAGVLCGPASLVMALHQPAAVVRATTDTGASAPQPQEVAAVGEWAQSFVVAWLTTPAGQEQSLSYYLPDVSDLTLPQVPQVVANPAVADLSLTSASPAASAAVSSQGDASTQLSTGAPSQSAVTATGDGSGDQVTPGVGEPSASATTSEDERIWQVTIGVDVQEPGPQGNVFVRRYFAVPVVYVPAQLEHSSALRALSLPGPVSAPVAGEGPESIYQDGLPLTGAVGSSVQAFLSAYLTDQGDVTRLLSPKAVGIFAVRPAAYTAAQLRILKADRRDVENKQPTDGEHVQVLATALLTGLDTQTRSAQFALTLTARDGRWEINQVQATAAGADSRTASATAEGGQSTSRSASADTIPQTAAGSPSGTPTQTGGR